MENLSFARTYTLYYKRAFLFVKSYVRDDMIAEDITSEALIHLWETSKSEDIEHPLALLTAILRNKSLNYLTRERIKLESIESIFSRHSRDMDYRIASLRACDPEELFSSEIVNIIQKTLNALPEQTRQIFEMSRYDQMSVKEIAESMNIGTKGVEYHITKSLKVLRHALKDYLPIFQLLFLN